MEVDLSGIPLISALDEETRARSVIVRRYQDGEEIFIRATALPVCGL